MMEHALLNDESESAQEWGLVGGVFLGEVWRARVGLRVISLSGAAPPSTPSVKGSEACVRHSCCWPHQASAL